MTTAHETLSPNSPRLTVVRDKDGWELREELENVVVRITHVTDWHRVERTMRMFAGAISIQTLHQH